MKLGLGSKTTKQAVINREYVARTVPRSVYFDGTTDYLEIADHNDFSPTDGSNNDRPFSTACWVKRTDTLNFALLAKGDNTGSSMEWRIFVAGDKLYFDIYDNTTAAYRRKVLSSKWGNWGTWTHVITTYDGSESTTGMKIYINGVELAAGTGSGGSWSGIPNTSSKVTFGHLLSQGSYDFKGYAADIIYWKDYELTPEEARHIAGIQPTANYSVNPTVRAKVGLYSQAAASAVRGWWIGNADYTITAASVTTSYSAVEEGGCSGEVAEAEDCVNNGVEVPEGLICCRTTTTVPAVLGIQDSSTTSHHAKYKNNAVLSTAHSSNSPTASQLPNT